MKTMTCRQLDGACDLEFHADTFESMADQSKKHGMEMFQKGDRAHIEAMDENAEPYAITGCCDRMVQYKERRV